MPQARRSAVGAAFETALSPQLRSVQGGATADIVWDSELLILWSAAIIVSYGNLSIQARRHGAAAVDGVGDGDGTGDRTEAHAKKRHSVVSCASAIACDSPRPLITTHKPTQVPRAGLAPRKHKPHEYIVVSCCQEQLIAVNQPSLVGAPPELRLQNFEAQDGKLALALLNTVEESI
eukprot:6194186-Pleurochrysis_carterae.AAC.2